MRLLLGASRRASLERLDKGFGVASTRELVDHVFEATHLSAFIGEGGCSEEGDQLSMLVLSSSTILGGGGHPELLTDVEDSGLTPLVVLEARRCDWMF